MRIRINADGITTYSEFGYILRKYYWTEIKEIGIRVKNEKIKGGFGETIASRILYISQRELNDNERMMIHKEVYKNAKRKKYMTAFRYSDEIMEAIMQFCNKPIIETKNK